MNKNIKNKIREATVFQKSLSPSFYVVKYHRFDKDWYIGEESLVDDLEEAKAFTNCSEAEEGIDDFVEGLIIYNELPEYEIDKLINLEKEDWGDQYESEEKNSSGLIDDFPALELIKDNMEIKGIWSSKYEEKRKTIKNKIKETSMKKEYTPEERLDRDFELYDVLVNYLFDFYYENRKYARKAANKIMDSIHYGLEYEKEEESINKKTPKNNRVNKIKEKEDKLETKYFILGPGKITFEKDGELYDDDYFRPEIGKDIRRAIKADWDEDLANYYKGEGVKSIVFNRMEIKNYKYYTVWKITYDPEITDIEKLKSYLEGQMADGWGESFEQYPFKSDISPRDVRYEYFYSPWRSEEFTVDIEDY